MKNLYICRTPFQIMTAFLIKQKEVQFESDIIITNDFIDYVSISNRIELTKEFCKVYPLDLSKMNYIFEAISPKSIIKKLGLMWLEKEYNCIFTNGIICELEDAISAVVKGNFAIFDEGYSSYTEDFSDREMSLSRKHRLLKHIKRKWFGRELAIDKTNSIYLYDKDLLLKQPAFKVVDLWDRNGEILAKLRDFCNVVFSITVEKRFIREKYIFFEECLANDFKNNADMELIKRIAKKVGLHDFIVKLHPRDKYNRFKSLGINTYSGVSIPMEALLTMIDSSGKVFITYSSGAVLNYNFIEKSNAQIVLLYDLDENQYMDVNPEKREWFNKYISKYISNVYKPTSWEELERTLDSVGEK